MNGWSSPEIRGGQEDNLLKTDHVQVKTGSLRKIRQWGAELVLFPELVRIPPPPPP